MMAIPKRLKLMISTILLLLTFSMTAFASNPFTSKRAVVDQESGGFTKLTIYRNHPEDSTPFNVQNMFPGDAETKSYFLTVSYRGAITVHFHADIHPGYEKLAEVLKCKVVMPKEDKVLYDGLMQDMPTSLDHELLSRGATTDELTYEITTYLDTSVGNDYMNKELYADFRWWAEAQEIAEDDDSKEPEDSGQTSKPTQPTDHDTITDPSEAGREDEPFMPGELVNPPKTGDISLVPIIIAIIGCLLLLIFLLFGKRRKEDEHEQ